MIGSSRIEISSRHFASWPDCFSRKRLFLQHLQMLDLRPQLVEVERGRRLVEDLLLGGLGFLARRFVNLIGVVAWQVARAG